MTPAPEAEAGDTRAGARIDLHCHTRASFDGVADPAALVARAAAIGLTHLAVTDHDTLDGAFRARDAAPAGLQVLIGCEVLTLQGDLVFTADAPRFIVIAEPAPRWSHPSSPASLP